MAELLLKIKKIVKINRWSVKFIYFLFSCFTRKKEVCLCYGTLGDAYGNITALSSALKEVGVKHFLISDQEVGFFEKIKNIYIISISKVFVMDTNNIYWMRLSIHKGTQIFYCGHGGGAYKKMHFQALRSNNFEKLENLLSKRIDWVLSSSENIRGFVCENYRVSPERVLSLGLPRTDELFGINWSLRKRKILAAYPYLIGKKIVTFAPTFRIKDGIRTAVQLPLISLSKNHVILYRLHPTLEKNNSITLEHIYNVSDWSLYDLMAVTDVLITDYSSLIFDFSFMRSINIILYVPDNEDYCKNERELWFRPDQIVGREFVALNADELEDKIMSERKSDAKNIWERFMSSCDGGSSKKLALFIKENI